MGKKTLVLGATPHANRYAYLAVRSLVAKGHEVIPLGIEEGNIDGLKIETEKKNFKNVDTVTLYLRAVNQKEYLNYILDVIKPSRIIFNPGTENPELVKGAADRGIEPLYACTLVMLAAGNY